MIFDTHCHGYWDGLLHRQSEVREHMSAANVRRSVQVGVDWELSLRALDLARDWGDQTWCSVGLHPSTCQDLPADAAQDWMDRFEKLVQRNRDKTVAIGEAGLDYYHLRPGKEPVEKTMQQEFFRAQAALSLKLDLPMIIHSRNAADETANLLKECGIKRAVIHCFSEDLPFAEDLLAWSDEVYFSFSGILTYKNAAAIQDAARNLPLNRILVETDAPFLVPQPARDSISINEPAFVLHVMEFLKSLRSEPGDFVERQVWENSNRFFQLD
jgi:TatD DNase family protein